MDALREWLAYLDIERFLKLNPPLRLLLVVGIVVVLFVAVKLGCAFVRKKIEALNISGKKKMNIQSKAAEKVISAMDDNLFEKVIRDVKQFLYLLIALWGLRRVNIDVAYFDIVTEIFYVLCGFVGIKFFSDFIPFNIDLYLRKRGSTLNSSQIRSLLPIIQGVIWTTGLTIMLDNAGFHVSTIIAGLGIIGVAVGLAGQAILADFFSYIVILLDKPFKIGDFVVLSNGKSGQIIYIGPKTTRMLSLNNNVIVCANTEMTKGILENQGEITHREVEVEIGVALTVPMDIVRKVPSVLREVIESFPQCSFERACMLKFGTANYIFQLIYHVRPKNADLTEFMNIQSEVNLAYTERMTKEGMVGAYPTETLILTQPNDTPLRINDGSK